MSTTRPGGSWNFTRRARRDMRRLDRPVQERVIEALDRLVGDPPVGDVVKLGGTSDEYRRRVGDWRVRFTGDDRGTVQVPAHPAQRPGLPRLTSGPRHGPLAHANDQDLTTLRRRLGGSA